MKELRMLIVMLLLLCLTITSVFAGGQAEAEKGSESGGTKEAKVIELPEAFKPSPGEKTIKYEPREPPYKIAFVNGFAGNAWRIQAIQTAKAWAEKPKNEELIEEFRVVSVGDDLAAQIAAIDNFIASGYDAITFIALNPTAFNAVIQRAERAGTILVPFDNVLDTDAIVQINQDQKGMGRQFAEYVVENMPKPEGKILEVRGLQGNATDRDRHNGAKEYLDQFPDIEVVEVVGRWDTGTTQQVVADALATHGCFDGIFVQFGTAGAINALLDSDCPIVPIGGDPQNDVMQLMADHNIPGGTTGQSPTLSAVALEAATYLLQGAELPSLVLMSSPVLKNENLKAGVNYFPDLPPTFTNAYNFPSLGLTFTVQEIVGQEIEGHK